MTASKGITIPSGGGRHFEEAPGHSLDLKLVGRQTGESVMLFEQTVPAGTKSWHHLHHDSDEVAWVLEGEFTFKVGDQVTVGGPGTCVFMPRNVPHAWKNSGSGPGRAVYFYTPAVAGGFIEEMIQRPAGAAPRGKEDRDQRLQRYGWKLVGENPL